jgi:autotransporter translocation and assembly factor TamB
LNILFKKGKINLKNINLSEDNFSLGNAVFSNIDISQFVDSEIGGTLNGVGTYNGGYEKAKLKLSNFSIDSFKIPEIAIDALYSKNEIDLKFIFNFLKKKNQIDAKILTDNWLISKSSKIILKASGKFNIEDYKLPNNQIASGKLVYKLDASGTIEKPLISGDIDLKKGYYINQPLGTYIRDITLNCTIKNNSIFINRIYARDDSKNSGSVEGNGKIIITDNNANADVSMKIDNMKAFEQNWLDARLFGTLSLKGDLFKETKISGLLYTNNPKIDVSALIVLSSRDIDLLDKGQSKKQSDTKDAKFPIRCLINVPFEIRPELKIIGMGIDSTWIGGGKVFGDISDVKCEAKATIKKGKISVQDSTFKLKNGEIIFGDETLKINISAEKHLENMTVGARFTQYGEVSNVKFYSSPYLQKKDILSYMLFDKKSSEISTNEGLALFSIMNKATGVNGFDIMNKMKTVLGIDSIGIKKNSNSANNREYDAVSIGKKIGKVKISVDQGTAKSTTSVVVETKVAENTKLSVDLSKRDSFGAGVLWSKRY